MMELNKEQINQVFETVLEESDTEFEKRGDFETYIVYTEELPVFAIGYNIKTGQYGFKRYDIMKAFYKQTNIPMSAKPNYADLYKKAKNEYLLQVIRENIDNLEI